MIVVCEGCDRRFQVDAARIPAGGARVRCKRCGHRFRVAPASGAPAAPTTDDTTLEGTTAPAAPGELHFVTEPSAVEDGGTAPPDDAGQAAGERTGTSWEFGESIFKLEGAGEALAAEAPDGAAVATAAGAGIAEAGPEASSPPLAGAGDAAERPQAGPGTAESGAAEDAAAPVERLELAGEAISDRTEAPAAVAATAAEPGTGEVDDDVDPDVDLDVDLDAGLDAAFDLDLPAAPPAASAPAASAARGETPAWLEHAGWAAALVLLAALAHGAVRVAPAPSTAQAGTMALAEGLAAENVRGRFVENAEDGTLFRVSGELRNRGTSAAAYGVPLRLVLLDARGQPVGDAPVGPALAETAVREFRADALVARQEREAGALGGATIAPGTGIAFDAVVPALPEEAVRFRIRASEARSEP